MSYDNSLDRALEVARKRSREDPNVEDRSGIGHHIGLVLGIIGLVLGIIGLVLGIIGLVLGIIYSAWSLAFPKLEEAITATRGFGHQSAY